MMSVEGIRRCGQLIVSVVVNCQSLRRSSTVSSVILQPVYMTIISWCVTMNNHVHSAPQEHNEERKDSEHRMNTHNNTTIHKPPGLEK